LFLTNYVHIATRIGWLSTSIQLFTVPDKWATGQPVTVSRTLIVHNVEALRTPTT